MLEAVIFIFFFLCPHPASQTFFEKKKSEKIELCSSERIQLLLNRLGRVIIKGKKKAKIKKKLKGVQPLPSPPDTHTYVYVCVLGNTYIYVYIYVLGIAVPPLPFCPFPPTRSVTPRIA